MGPRLKTIRTNTDTRLLRTRVAALAVTTGCLMARQADGDAMRSRRNSITSQTCVTFRTEHLAEGSVGGLTRCPLAA
jgi:hypothetical protein